MTLKSISKQLTKTAVDNLKETSHWVFAIAPIIASVLATLFGRDAHILELVFIVAAIFINFLLLWLSSKFEEEKELSLFHTFWTNNLLPNRTGAWQEYDVKIAIIED